VRIIFLNFKLLHQFSLLGLRHTQYFCTQYCNKKIKRQFDKNIFFPSKYCSDILKSFQTFQNFKQFGIDKFDILFFRTPIFRNSLFVKNVSWAYVK